MLCILGVSFCHIFAEDGGKSSENVISVAMATDNNYIYPTIVSLTSLSKNANKNTKYNVYIMHPDNLTEESKSKLYSVEKKNSNCTINLINMKNTFEASYTDNRIPRSAYYRLAMADVIPNVDKIIWLDGDTLIFKDLSEMFQIDMEGFYFKGYLDFPNMKQTGNFGIYNDHYICSGVMLANLKELRRDNLGIEKFSEFIVQNNDKLCQHDQTVINTICAHKNGILPPQFGTWNFDSEDSLRSFQNCLIYPEKYSAEDMINAWKNPTILHCTNKPWKALTKDVYIDQWWRYAEESGFLKEIQEKYLIPDGTYEISPVCNSNKSLNISNIKYNLSRLHLANSSRAASQKFKVKYSSLGAYTIETSFNKTLYFSDVSKSIKQSPRNRLNSHKWYILPNGGGRYKIASKLNKNFMTAKKHLVNCEKENWSASQQFVFKKIG